MVMFLSSSLYASMVLDDANILSKDKRLIKMYKLYNKKLLEDFDIDFRVATTNTKDNIDIFSNKLFKKLQKDSKSHSGKALLLVLNVKQDKVRLEVSMALEGVYTDSFVSYIQRKGFVPYFRDSKILDGVYMALELIRDRAFEAQKGKEFMPPMKSKSIGAGAKTKAFFNQKDIYAKDGENVQAFTKSTPLDVLKSYMRSLKSHNKNPNLDIYTDKTKVFFANHTVTDINQNNEIKFLKNCIDTKKTLFSDDNHYAVLLNDPVKQRKCTPHFFKKEHGKWKLDIATMAQTLRFNQTMQWHFDMQNRLKDDGIYYAFAFDKLWFDKNGYPYKTTKKERKTDDMRWGFSCNGWYNPGEDVKNHPKKYIKCWINRVWPGSPAQVRLGLVEYDYIYSVGEGSNKIDNVTYVEFMKYMKNLSKGEKATVVVKQRNKKTIKRVGIAP